MALYDDNDPDVIAYKQRLQQQAQPQQGVLNQIDPKWLALAQGFLAPTRTGSFGESVGNAAGQLQGPLSKMNEQQMTALEKIAQLKETQARLQLAREKQAQGGDDNYLSEEYKRALSLNSYNNLAAGVKKDFVDQFGSWNSPTAEAEYQKKVAPLQSRIDALMSHNRPGGKTAIGEATGNDTNQPILMQNPTVTTTPRKGDPGVPKEISKEEVLSKYPTAFQRGNDWIVVNNGQEYKIVPQ